VNFVIFLLLDSTADLRVNIEKKNGIFQKGPEWMEVDDHFDEIHFWGKWTQIMVFLL